MNPLLDAALDYAAYGWPVFMCWPGRKEPHSTFAPRGFKSATTNPLTIRAWWARCPDANVAIATGDPGPDVVDVDRKEAGTGFPALNRLQRAGLLVGAQRLVSTPSGGVHLYYRGTDQGNGSIRGQYVDFRSTGGYVLAPPSEVSGKPYTLVEWRQATGTVSWATIRRLLNPPRPKAKKPSPTTGDTTGLVAWLASKKKGDGRNNCLFWVACRALEAGEDLDPLAGPLALAAISTGLTPRAVELTILSAIDTIRGTSP